MVIMEPVQNAGGAFTPPKGYFEGVRAICDRYGILLCADEVITGFGRLGDWFGSDDATTSQPDLVTCAKGLSSAYAAIGAVIASDRVMEPFPRRQGELFTHGITFGGHPVSAAIALKNIEIMKRERRRRTRRENEPGLPRRSSSSSSCQSRVTCAAAGYFWAIELVKDKETRRDVQPKECESLLRGFLSGRLFERGLICRADDRGDPVDPDLSAADRRPEAEFDEITGILGDVLTEAWERVTS
jgi:adenosylmethionine-8-amino-7-oxononanoate aminotransferase